MIKIPTIAKKFSIPNNSDLFGNIWYTKNANFDEEGYAKLSSRSVSLQSEEDNANFDIPLSFGRTDPARFLIAAADEPWILNVDAQLGITSTEDTDSGNPGLSFDSWGRWWQNRWHVTSDTGVVASLYYKPANTSTWTDASVSLALGKVHPIEVFRNKISLCIGNGNEVLLVSTTYVVSTTKLIIPTDYEVIGLAYSNNRMGVVTKLSDTAAGQNQEAYFFVWDGASNEANGGYPVGSDTIIGITAYKSSWAILTRTGQLQYFNGGGFDIIATLPYYYQSLILSDSTNRSALGDIMQVEGDVIYLNLSNDLNRYGVKQEEYLENYPSGILCYDPKVSGFYHRYSPSISKMFSATALQASVNTTTDTITLQTSVAPATGSIVMQTYNTPIGGLTIGEKYYVINVSSSSFKVALTKADALAGTAIDLTSQGSATNYFNFVDIVDYGASYNGQRTGGIALVEMTSLVYDHMFFGGEYEDSNSTGSYSHVCMTVPSLPNIGYLVSAKITSENIEDVMQKVYVKYRPLDTDDKIVIKYKDKDILGLPVTTPQSGIGCSWTSSTTFTTTADFSEAAAYLSTENELECEITSGAGAGQVSQIASISLLAGTYTVTLADALEGAANGNFCNVLINNWKKLGEVTPADMDGHKEFPIAESSKWCKIKAILYGVDTTIEELQLINKTQLASV